MFSRIISTLILWTLTIAMIFWGRSVGLTLIVWALSSAAIFETCEILFRLGLRPMFFTAQLFNAFVFAASWTGAAYGQSQFAGGAIAVSICAVLLSLAIIGAPYNEFFTKSFAPTLLILFGISFMLQWYAAIAAAFTIPSRYTGSILAIWIIATAKFSDVGAYVIGSAFGKHKMSPKISPKKTWEGWIGGLFSAAAISATFARFGAEILPQNFTPIAAAIAGIAIGAAATASDLLESVLKRRAEIKDSGSVIPGIGGALDLADSLVLASPVGLLAIMTIL